MTTNPNQLKTGVLYPVIAAITVIFIGSLFSLYSEVHANTQYREDSDKRMELVLQMNNSIIELKTEIKYLRKDIDDLKQVNQAAVMASKSNQIERSTTE